MEDLLHQLTGDKNVIDNWYCAREYVSVKLMDKMCRMDASGKFLAPLHVVAEGTSPLMCAVIREIILRAHYYDFDEDNPLNASCIIVLCSDEKKGKETLLNTPFLGNYLRYSWGVEGVEPLYFLDVRVDIRTQVDEDKNAIVLTENELSDFCNNRVISHAVDVRRAQYASQAYRMGQVLDNLPDINSTDVFMYEIPLRAFEAKSFDEDDSKKWSTMEVEEKLSNVFCVDTFDIRIKMLKRAASIAKEDRDVSLLNNNEIKSLTCEVEKNILGLSKCEHLRWVTEKLILGFEPWSFKNHYEYSLIFDKTKKKYRTTLKNMKRHYNICSYRDLCRRDPASRKYDTFLVLAMLHIDKRVKTQKSSD